MIKLKRIIGCFTLLIWFVSCHDSPERIIKENHSNGTPKYVEHFQESRLIKTEQFHDNGVRQSVYMYSDSLRYFRWNLNDVIVEEGVLSLDSNSGFTIRYRNGIKADISIEVDGVILNKTYYHIDGKKKIEMMYRNSIDMPNSHSWYENGKLRMEENEFGVGFSYYETGEKESSFFSKDWKNDSLHIFWDKEGKVIKEEVWDMGELIETKEY
jgi:antitoxin component YwqK of YwqJK toxin-antitoxin module